MTDKSTQAADAARAVIREQSWTFRRWYTYGVTAANLGGVGWALLKLDDAASLRWIALALIGLNAILATYYLIGPTAEHIVAAVQAFRQRRDD